MCSSCEAIGAARLVWSRASPRTTAWSPTRHKPDQTCTGHAGTNTRQCEENRKRAAQHWERNLTLTWRHRHFITYHFIQLSFLEQSSTLIVKCTGRIVNCAKVKVIINNVPCLMRVFLNEMIELYSVKRTNTFLTDVSVCGFSKCFKTYSKL